MTETLFKILGGFIMKNFLIEAAVISGVVTVYYFVDRKLRRKSYEEGYGDGRKEMAKEIDNLFDEDKEWEIRELLKEELH